tara:strand:+ start:887 stop:2002 length:1116 start_codon:yes stop_codon:yes gene_type:complete
MTERTNNINFSENLREIEKIYNSIENELLGLGVVAVMASLCSISLFVKDGKKRGCNLLLIIPKGGGKKEVLEPLTKKNKNIIIPFSKGTETGIVTKLSKEYFKHHVWVVEDLISTVATLGKNGLNDFCAFHNEFLEKGHYEKATGFGEHKVEGKIVCLYGIALEEFRKHEKKWKNLTFMDRFIPFHFTYTNEEDDSIGKRIFDGNIKIPEIKLPNIKRERKIEWDNELTSEALNLSRLLKKGRDSSFMARASIDIKKLCMASALINKRDSVVRDDLLLVKSLIPYMINPVCFSSLTFKIIQFVRNSRDELISEDIIEYFSERGYKEKTIEYHLKQIRSQNLINHEERSREKGGIYYVYYSDLSQTKEEDSE